MNMKYFSMLCTTNVIHNSNETSDFIFIMTERDKHEQLVWVESLKYEQRFEIRCYLQHLVESITSIVTSMRQRVESVVKSWVWCHTLMNQNGKNKKREARITIGWYEQESERDKNIEDGKKVYKTKHRYPVTERAPCRQRFSRSWSHSAFQKLSSLLRIPWHRLEM